MVNLMCLTPVCVKVFGGRGPHQSSNLIIFLISLSWLMRSTQSRQKSYLEMEISTIDQMQSDGHKKVISKHPVEWYMKNMNCFSPVQNSSWHYFQLALDDVNCIWCWNALGEPCGSIKCLQMAVWADRWRVLYGWLYFYLTLYHCLKRNVTEKRLNRHLVVSLFESSAVS